MCKKQIQITDGTGRVLYEGIHKDIREAAESATAAGLPLHGANFSHRNMTGASLDGALMEGAIFRDANLIGANLSESRLSGADFTDAVLHGACMAFAELAGCVFRGAFFGATDIAGCVLDGSVFSTLSAFSLDFVATQSMQGCRFEAADGEIYPLSRPPLVVLGLGSPVALLDGHVLIGHKGRPAVVSAEEGATKKIAESV